MFTDESFEKKAESPARMSQEDLLEFFNSLKPKEEVLIWYDSGIRRADDWTPMTVGRRSESKKYNLKKVSLTGKHGGKFILYNRQGKISLAIGGMATVLVAAKKNGSFGAETFNAPTHYTYYYTLSEQGEGDNYDTLEEAQEAVSNSDVPMEIYGRRVDRLALNPQKDIKLGAENSDMDKKALVESKVGVKMNELFEFVQNHVGAEDGAGGDLYDPNGLDEIENAVSDYFVGYWDFESRHNSNNPRYQNAETFESFSIDTDDEGKIHIENECDGCGKKFHLTQNPNIIGGERAGAIVYELISDDEHYIPAHSPYGGLYCKTCYKEEAEEDDFQRYNRGQGQIDYGAESDDYLEGVEKGIPIADIDWETDGEDSEEMGLPSSVRVPSDLEEDEIADYLSDEYGFLVNGFVVMGAETFEAEHKIIKEESDKILIQMTDDEATIDNAEEIIDFLVELHRWDYESDEEEKELFIYFEDEEGKTLRSLNYVVRGNKVNDAIIDWFSDYDYPIGGYTAETFEATKGIDTFTEPFEDIGISKPYARLGVIAAGITALAFGVKKLRK